MAQNTALNTDCNLAGYGGTCQNCIGLQQLYWSGNPNNQYYWRFIPVTKNGSTYYAIKGILYNGVETNVYLYATGGGRDCQDGGFDGCMNAIGVNNTTFKAAPLYWKVTAQ